MKKLATTLLIMLLLGSSFLLSGCGGSLEKSRSTLSEDSLIEAAKNLNAYDSKPIENNQSSSQNTTSSSITKYSTGTYIINRDIPSGFYGYKITDTYTGMGYVERCKDVSGDFNSIIANGVFAGSGYFRLKDTDFAVKVSGIEFWEIPDWVLNSDWTNSKSEPQNEATDGVYIVGKTKDIIPGIYKVEVTDTVTNIGYVARLKDVSMSNEDIIANEIFQGPGYIEIKSTDFAVQIQGARITLN